MDDLKPCPNPWCEGKRLIRWELYGKQVLCTCGVKGPVSEGRQPRCRETDMNIQAIAAWNTRTPPKVKALEWEACKEDRGDGTFDETGDFHASTMVGMFFLELIFVVTDCHWKVIINDLQIGKGETIEAAKAAAQAHYNAMILEALE